MSKIRAQFADATTLKKIEIELGREAWLPMWLMLETGVRVGDACKARAGDFHKDEDGRCYFEWVAEKTDKAGVSEISPALYDQIDRLRLTAEKFIFPGNAAGRHITRQALWKRLKTACKALGIRSEGISPHTLRKVKAVRERRENGFRAAKNALQHTHDSTAALYAYADALADPESPITWGQLDLLADFICAKLKKSID